MSTLLKRMITIALKIFAVWRMIGMIHERIIPKVREGINKRKKKIMNWWKIIYVFG